MKRLGSIIVAILVGWTHPARGHEANLTVRAGQKFTSKLTSLNPNCAPFRAAVHFAQLPHYGHVRIYRSTDLQRDNPNPACNNRIVPAIAIEYRAPPNFIGQDRVSVVFGDRVYRLHINIIP